jgi:hypothetical protein
MAQSGLYYSSTWKKEKTTAEIMAQAINSTMDKQEIEWQFGVRVKVKPKRK